MKRYDLTLDVISLSMTYPEQAYSLTVATQKTALAFLNMRASKKELLQLIKIASDLGYVDDELFKLHTRLLNKR